MSQTRVKLSASLTRLAEVVIDLPDVERFRLARVLTSPSRAQALQLIHWLDEQGDGASCR